MRIEPIVLLAGDYPDPTVIRVGTDYYMTHSSFDYSPGLLLWHSRDLLDWKPIGHALRQFVGNVQAPDLVYFDGLFYIYFPAGPTNWVIAAPSPEGPWSDPVDLRIGGIDPGHLADSEGNRYLFLSDGRMIRLAPDGLSTVGEPSLVYEGWRYPSEWRTEGFYLESPKLTYRNGCYYMTSAQGGTAGPATSHMAVSARSPSPLGPWENSPHNPIVRTRARTERWHSQGHGTLVDTPDGRWFIVYHAYEKDYMTLGRYTLMEPIRWDDDGWFRTDVGAACGEGGGTAPAPVFALSDRFDRSELAPHWSFCGKRSAEEYAVGGGELVLKGRPFERTAPLLCIPRHHAYEASVTVRTEARSSGTLSLFYKPGFQCGVGFDGRHVYAFRNDYRAERVAVAADCVELRLVNDRHEVDLYYRLAGGEWTKLDHSFEMSGFHHNVLGSFLSLRVALEAVGEGNAVFGSFAYREWHSEL